MSVKDVLQSLVDDGLVDTDRIGTSNYFWAFPSKVANTVGESGDTESGSRTPAQFQHMTACFVEYIFTSIRENRNWCN